MFKWINQIFCSHDFEIQPPDTMMFHYKYICKRCDKVKYVEKKNYWSKK